MHGTDLVATTTGNALCQFKLRTFFRAQANGVYWTGFYTLATGNAALVE
jgi:hypothetical protein